MLLGLTYVGERPHFYQVLNCGLDGLNQLFLLFVKFAALFLGGSPLISLRNLLILHLRAVQVEADFVLRPLALVKMRDESPLLGRCSPSHLRSPHDICPVVGLWWFCFLLPCLALGRQIVHLAVFVGNSVDLYFADSLSSLSLSLDHLLLPQVEVISKLDGRDLRLLLSLG